MAKQYVWIENTRHRVNSDGVSVGYGPDKVYVGPAYPKLGATVEKFRRAAANGTLSKAERRAYGEAVEKAIKALQRQELQSSLRAIAPIVNCASGTNHNNKDKLHAALQAQLHGYQAWVGHLKTFYFERRPWQKIYEATMRGENVRHSINGG